MPSFLVIWRHNNSQRTHLAVYDRQRTTVFGWCGQFQTYRKSRNLRFRMYSLKNRTQVIMQASVIRCTAQFAHQTHHHVEQLHSLVTRSLLAQLQQNRLQPPRLNPHHHPIKYSNQSVTTWPEHHHVQAAAYSSGITHSSGCYVEYRRTKGRYRYRRALAQRWTQFLEEQRQLLHCNLAT